MQQKVYKHLITELLGFKMTDPIPTALSAIKAESIPDIIALRENDLADLRYKHLDSEQVETILPLAKGEQRFIACIPSFLMFQRSQGIELKEEGWLDVSADEFQNYRGSPEFIDMRTGNLLPPPPT
jgi:hypothetical protein